MTAILEPQTTTPPARDRAPEAPVRVEPAPLPPAPPVASASAPAPILASAPAPAAPRRPGRLRTLLTAKAVLTPAGIRLVGVALLALFWAAVELEPVADGPQPTVTGWVAVLGTVQTFALLAGAAGFAMGRRWALWAGLVFGGLTAVGIAMCPASGHHLIGGWWYGQVALGVAMLLLPALALGRTRR